MSAQNESQHRVTSAEERRAHYLRAIGLDAWSRSEHLLQSSQQNEGIATVADVDDPARAAIEEKLSSVQVALKQSPAQPKPQTLLEVAERVRLCQACELHQHRQNTVFGIGEPGVDWMFVGEAPGAQEDRQGEPFVGRAGQLLNAILSAMKMTRDDVYIANVLKCRPPGNRDPMGEEVRRCEPYLLEQIQIVRPKMLIAMGRFAAQSLLRSTDAIGRLRGRVHHYEACALPLIVTYHPAYLLRSPLEKRKVWNDLLLARQTLDGVDS